MKEWAEAASQSLNRIPKTERELENAVITSLNTYHARRGDDLWKKQKGEGWQSLAANELAANLKFDVKRFSEKVRPLLEDACNRIDQGKRFSEQLRNEAAALWRNERDNSLKLFSTNGGLIEYLSRRLKLLGEGEIVAWCNERVPYRVILLTFAELELMERAKAANSIGMAVALADVRAMQTATGDRLLKQADANDKVVESLTKRMQDCTNRVERIERAKEQELRQLLFESAELMVA